MPVAVLLQSDEANADLYDRFNEEMGIDDSNLPEGLISHTAGDLDGTWTIFDVWESREAFERFAQERLAPTGEKLGAPAFEPRVFDVYNQFRAGVAA